MGVFGAVRRRSGDGSFSGPLLGVCSGGVGFHVAMLSRLVRDIRRPTRSDVGASAKKLALRHCSHRVSAKKFAQHTKKGSKWVFDGALGELLRGNAAGGAALGELLRGNVAGGVVRGELLRGNAAGGAALGELLRGNVAGGVVRGELLRRNAAGGAVRGEFFRGPAVVGSRRASLLSRVPGSRTLLLAVLTLQCAAKPYWWHGGQPAQATTYRVNVRMKGPRPPPIGLTCASKGPGHHPSGPGHHLSG